MRLSIGRQVIVGFILALAIQLLVGAWSYYSMVRFKEALDARDRSFAIRDHLSHLRTHLVDAETGQRGFLLTGDEPYLEPYHQALMSVEGDYAALKRLFAEDGQDETELLALRTEIEQKLAELKMTIELKRTNGFDAAAIEVRKHRGRSLMDQLRKIIGELTARRQEILDERAAAVHSWRQTLMTVVVLGSLLATVVIATAMYFIFREVAFRDRAERELQRLNTELEDRVKERTAELAQANRDLVQRNQENELFVYSVSHDLRGPLVNLQGFSKELTLTCQDVHTAIAEDGTPPAVRDRVNKLLDGDVAESIRYIQAGVMRLSNIIDALLRLSRAGRVEYQWQRVDVQGLVKRVVDSMQQTITEKGATFSIGNLPPTWGDPTAMEQVFGNLVSNALKYLDPKRPGIVEVGFGGNGATSPTYYVKDNGLGIPKAYQDKLFQAFRRFHPEAAPGEGIGLAIVRRVVHRHHGNIWVESQEGEGTTFRLALPGSAAAVAA